MSEGGLSRLQKWILSKVLKAYEAKLKAVDISASEYNEVVRKKTNQDALELAIALLYAEARLGELLKGISKPKYIKDADGSLKGTVRNLPPGITKKQSHYAQKLFEHIGLIKEVIFLREAKDGALG